MAWWWVRLVSLSVYLTKKLRACSFGALEADTGRRSLLIIPINFHQGTCLTWLQETLTLSLSPLGGWAGWVAQACAIKSAPILHHQGFHTKQSSKYTLRLHFLHYATWNLACWRWLARAARRLHKYMALISVRQWRTALGTAHRTFCKSLFGTFAFWQLGWAECMRQKYPSQVANGLTG